jgi:hypothetical protein
MTRMCALRWVGYLAVAGWAYWAAGPIETMTWAAEATETAPAPTEGEVTIQTAEPVAMEPACGRPGLVGRIWRHGEPARRLWDWLTYCPQSCPRCCSGCGRHCKPTCVPPLYMYFMWQVGCSGDMGCAHGCGMPAVGVTPVSHNETAGMATAPQP